MGSRSTRPDPDLEGIVNGALDGVVSIDEIVRLRPGRSHNAMERKPGWKVRRFLASMGPGKRLQFFLELVKVRQMHTLDVIK